MKKHAEVTAYIQALPSPQQQLCAAIRGVLHDHFPQLQEKWSWSRPVYASVDGNVCYMVANKADVNLGFDRGAHIDDPHKLLRGDGANMRHIKYVSIDDFDADVARQYIAAAVSARR